MNRACLSGDKTCDQSIMVDSDELDPRIQIELENLNKSTDEINKLEIELDEANTTFRMLLNESTRRLKLLSKKLGSCIEKSRAYYEALDVAKLAQKECQKAAVAFQRSNEIHAAAKETVALAEQRFMSNQHEWQFDNAWQEMLNHATMKVMDADNKKAEHGREHQKKALLFHAAEQKVQQLEDSYRRIIIKARPYFDEKALCQEQLNTQKNRIETLKKDIVQVKRSYAQSLKHLEQISNEIHLKRQRAENDLLTRPREPGVGAELNITHSELQDTHKLQEKHSKLYNSLPDFNLELDLCDIRSCSGTTSSVVSERDDSERTEDLLRDVAAMEEYKVVSARPQDGAGEGKSTDVWVDERLTSKLQFLQIVAKPEMKTKIGNAPETVGENIPKVVERY